MPRMPDRTVEEIWALRRDAVRILDVIVAAWQANPAAAAPIDAVVQARARAITARLRALEQRAPGL